MLMLNNLKSPKGSNRDTKRIGRGQGSGQGTQAGKGHKGQKARKSGGTRIGFEGGSMPIYMRLPKRGFKNEPFRKDFAVVNIGDLDKYFTNEDVTREALVEKGLLKGADRKKLIKVLGEGSLSKPLNFVKLDKFSKSATDAIAKAGGKIL